MTQVINRKGGVEDLDINQIRKVVDFATQGLSVSPLELETRFRLELKPVITTTEIQEALINKSSEMIFEHPDWDLVASRLILWNLYKNYTLQVDKEVYSNYYLDLKRLEKECKLDSSIFADYSPNELLKAGTWINKDYDLFFPCSGILLLSQRVLLSATELPQTAFLTLALLLSKNEPNRMDFAHKLYHAIASRKISLATPILNNLRSKKDKSYTSCFISTIDDKIESIFDEVKNTALISKNGGGVGLNLSQIRARGSDLRGKDSKSGGIIPWCKIINDVAIAVNQGGKRSGAITVAIDIWHADIIHFLDMSNEHGDQRLKSYDLFPQVVIPDLFMQRIANNELWTLFCPHEVLTHYGIDLPKLWCKEFEEAYLKIEGDYRNNQPDFKLKCTKQLKVKELFGLIMRNAEQRGVPYLFFKDTVNRANPNKHEGYIPNGNLCMESFSNVATGKYIHCCNLVSLNLATIEIEEIPEISNLAVRLLDNTIELTTPPVPEAKAHNNRYRTIGVGIMGLADYLAKNDFTYQDLDKISEVTELISYHCIKTSMKLAQERGCYPAFEGSDWSKGMYNSYTGEELNNRGNLDWVTLLSDVQNFGIRNSHIMAIAPNTSSSLVQGCTASVLPLYNHNFMYKSGNRTDPIVPPYDSSKYQINTKLRQEIVVTAIATIQQWIDTGISMELVFNSNPNVYEEGFILQSPKDTFKVYNLAWQLGCKTIYYTRTVQSEKTIKSEPTCDCAN
jgi:ribonucleoside-diphosphate reductase alpha chain